MTNHLILLSTFFLSFGVGPEIVWSQHMVYWVLFRSESYPELGNNRILSSKGKIAMKTEFLKAIRSLKLCFQCERLQFFSFLLESIRY